MEPIRMVLATDHPLLGAGVHIIENARHLFEDLAPDTLLIEMTIATDPPAPVPGQPLAALPIRVFALRGYHNRAYVFGLLAGEPAAVPTEHAALQLIARALLAGRSDAAAQAVPSWSLPGAPGGMPDLTARERDVVRELADGKSDQEIGERLGITKSTVRYHLQHIYLKLGVTRRSEAIARAIQAGIQPVPA